MSKRTEQAQAKAEADLERANAHLEMEIVAIDSISPNNYNPNRQSVDQFQMLTQSINEDGFLQPVVVNRKTRVIVDGEHRWRAMQAVGATQIAVVFVDMDEAEVRVGTLAYNWARGEEDIQLAANVTRDLMTTMDPTEMMATLGLSKVEIDRLARDILPAEVLSPISLQELMSLPVDQRQQAAASASDQVRSEERILEEQKARERLQMQIRDQDRFMLMLTVAKDTPVDEYYQVIAAFNGQHPRPELVFELLQEYHLMLLQQQPQKQQPLVSTQ